MAPRNVPSLANQSPSWLAPVSLLLLVVALAVSTTRDGGPSPIVWFGLATYLALRQRRSPWVPTLYVPATVLFLLWFAHAAMGMFMPFVVGLLLAYLLDPLIDKMEPRLGRSRAIVVVAVPSLAAVVGLVILIVPSLLGEFSQLGKRLPELRDTFQEAYAWVITKAQALGLELRREDLAGLLLERIEAVTGAVGGATTGLWRGAQGLLAVVSFLVVTPVVTFYLLRDFDRLREQLVASIPDQRRTGFERFLAQLDRSISGYVRGQLLVGSALGVLFYLGLTLLGIEYALLVGVSSVLFNFVPYVGSVLTAVLALAVGLLTDPSWASVAKVGGLYAVLQLADSAVVSPRIMGHSLQLHPVFVMIAVLLGGQFYGLIGILLAVPAAALLKESLVVWTPQMLGLLPGLQGDAPTSSDED